MKKLQKAQPKTYVILTALMMLMLCLFTGFGAGYATVEAKADEPTLTYTDTEVAGVAFSQQPGCVYLGFHLTECDYDDGVPAYQEGMFGGREDYFESQLTYRKNFASMNSEGVIFDFPYAYWNSGWNVATNTTSLSTAAFSNTVAHRTNLQLLEFGFTVLIPAGTTFPKMAYAVGTSNVPEAYKTVSDKAFYYDNNKFVEMDYSVAMAKVDAIASMNDVDLSVYYEAEATAITELVHKTKETLKVSFTAFAIQDALAEFSTNASKIMTKDDYVQLAASKEEAKASLAIFFSGVSQSAYEDAEWATIVSMKESCNALVDACKRVDEVDALIVSVRFAVDNVLTAEEKANFAQYRAAAVARLNAAFDASLYREAECAQGTALVQAGKQALEGAMTIAGVDAIAAEYIAQIVALKTNAQWEAEEGITENDSTNEESNSATDSSIIEDEGGCGSVVGSIGMIFGVTIIAASMTIKNKVGKRDEE